MPKTIIYSNLLPFIGILSLMIFQRVNPLFDKQQNKIFFRSSIIILFMLIVISTDYMVSLIPFDEAWIIRRITSFFNFSFSCIVPIFLINIFVNKKMNNLLYLPAIINLVICFMSMFSKLVFYFPKEGGYQRGPLFIFPFIVTVYYLVFLLVLSVKDRKERSLEFLFLVITILNIVLALYLEIVHYLLFLSWDFAAVFLILYYLLLNINKSKLDPLTGAYNRLMYMQKIDIINRNSTCIIAMIDINGFKTINDTKGHVEGDKILIQCVKIIKSFMDRKNILYRIGGDEFVILSEEESMEKFKKRIEACLTKLREQNIYCAIGIATYNSNVDIEATIHIADAKMYEDKQKFYSNNT